ncbi:hypothetical protein LguiB_020978 [Lonicera macranthoides]
MEDIDETAKHIADLYAQLDLGEDGLNQLDLKDGDSDPTNKEIKWSIVGRFNTKRPINFRAMRSKMASVWSPFMKMWVKELGPNLFLFQFFDEADLERVKNDGPWTFDQHLFVFKQISVDTNPYEVTLTHVEFWVQVYDLAVGFMSEKVAKDIGNFIGEYCYADPSNFNGLWRTYMRIRVSINISKSLRRKMQIKKVGQEEAWVNFKYEKLPNFCFFCGVIGHAEKFCQVLFKFPDKTMPRLFGTWLRAIGKRDTYSEGDPWLKKSANEDEEPPTTMRYGGNTMAAGGGRAVVHDGELIRGKKVISNGPAIIQKDSAMVQRYNPVINGIELANSILVDKYKENSNMSQELAEFNLGGTSQISKSQQDLLPRNKDSELGLNVGQENNPDLLIIMESKRRRQEAGLGLLAKNNEDVEDPMDICNTLTV